MTAFSESKVGYQRGSSGDSLRRAPNRRSASQHGVTHEANAVFLIELDDQALSVGIDGDAVTRRARRSASVLSSGGRILIATDRPNRVSVAW